MNIKYLPALTAFMFCTFFIVAMLPFMPLLGWGTYNHHRVVQLGLLSIGFLILCLKSQRINKVSQASLILVCLSAVFLAGGFLSTLISVDQAFSFMLWFHYLLLFGLFFGAREVNSENLISCVLFTFGLSFCAITLISTLNIVFTFIDGNELSPHLIYDGFINIRFFNQVQAFVLPLLVCCLYLENYRRIVAVFLFLNCILMFIGYGRGIILTYIAFLALLGLLNAGMREQTKLAVYILVSSFLAFVGLKYLAAGHGEGLAVLLRVSGYGRVDGWLDLLRTLELHHLFYGEGPGMYRHSWGSSVISHPHNSLLQILYEWGAIALCALLGMKLLTLKHVVCHLRNAPADTITWALASMWFCGLAYSMFSGVIVMPVPQTLTFMVWGLLVGRVIPSDVTRIAMNPIFQKLMYLTIMILIVGFYFYLSSTAELSSLIEIGKPYGGGTRFWQQGVRFSDFE